MKKLLILVLILLLPAAIFLFLKGFGENEFAVKKYYQNSSPQIEGCSKSYEIPYRVGNTSWLGDFSGTYDFNVIHFATDSERFPEASVNMARVYDTFLDKERVGLFSVFPSEDSTGQKALISYLQESVEWDTSKWYIKSMSRQEIDSIQRCVLFTGLHEEGRADLVLLDESSTIRGYYQSDKVLETDTLILELKILLKEE